MLIKDPLQVRFWERRLRRPLTVLEKYGHDPVLYKGQQIYLELQNINFPYGFMDRLQVVTLLNRYNK